MLQHPGYHDILILYMVPMLFLPFAIFAIKKGKAALVITISLLLWLAAPFISINALTPLHQYLFPDITINVSYFDPLAWQLYFYLGVLLSHLKLDKQHNFNFSVSTKTVLLIALVVLFYLKHWPQEWMKALLAEPQILSTVRLVNLLIVIYGMMLWMRYAPRFFTLKYPVFLGQHALPVFSFHTIVIYYLLPATYEFTTEKWYWDLLSCLFFVALLAIPAKLDQLYRNKKRYRIVNQAKLSNS
ncbi:hypothetical protein GCM10009111_30920 [Colwellia asteriadis]|uniref:Acyltransferase 3 domain-containing protein n=1 Tax=Colwellia asteriadis TaxID=517723 RepID=A0ABN1LBF2_9GAMM